MKMKRRAIWTRKEGEKEVETIRKRKSMKVIWTCNENEDMKEIDKEKEEEEG